MREIIIKHHLCVLPSVKHQLCACSMPGAFPFVYPIIHSLQQIFMECLLLCTGTPLGSEHMAENKAGKISTLAELKLQ